MNLGRTLIIAGIALVAAGVLVTLAGRWSSFGRLPGDFVVRRGGMTFYFPLATCLLLSAALTLAMWLIRRR